MGLMKQADFTIGKTFTCGNKSWLCTDIGTRVIVAVEWRRDWSPGGPPYLGAEIVFNEQDMRACFYTGRDINGQGK